MHRRNMMKLCGAAMFPLLLPWKAKPCPLVVGPGETLRLESGKHYPWIEVRGGHVRGAGTDGRCVATVGRIDMYAGSVYLGDGNRLRRTVFPTMETWHV